MSFDSAVDFLPACGPLIRNETVQSWVWEEGDDTFGKMHSWNIGGDGVEAIASVDLQLTQLTLSISERDITGEDDPRHNDTVITFIALIQFEDRTVTFDGEPLPFTSQAIQDVIRQFNERI